MADQTALHELFLDELRDMYDAEKQIVKALPKMIKGASQADLREVLSSHLEETKGHVSRLEQAFESLGEKARGKHCAGIKGILDEGAEMLEELKGTPAVNAGIVAGCQKVEHYEMSSYGTLVAWARLMGHEEVVELLEQTEGEERAADEKLTELSEDANSAANEAEGEEAESQPPPTNARGRKSPPKKKK